MSNPLQVFKANDLDHLHRLALRLYYDGFFNCYLSGQMFNLLSVLFSYKDEATSKTVWEALMNCNLSVEIVRDLIEVKEEPKRESEDETNEPEKDAKPEPEKDDNDQDEESDEKKDDDAPEEAAPPTEEDLYLRPGFGSARNLCTTLRYLLYEKAVDYYYGSKDDEKEFEVFESAEVDEEAEETANTEEPVKEPVRDEEDDYDDDDEEEDEQPKEAEKNVDVDVDVDVDGDVKMAIEDALNSPLPPKKGENGEIIVEIPFEVIVAKPNYPTPGTKSSSEHSGVRPILSTVSAIESNLEKQNEIKLIKNFNKVYHGFEGDMRNIVKRRRLEKSNKQLDLDGEDVNEEAEERNVNKLMSLGGAVNLSLKNLLGRIEDNRDKLTITDIELKNLIMDVRKNRSKWANYNRIGQEELYEACEKVVTELRGYTEHSTPFLNRVAKREAPNYYQVIKKPMDLNTVMRKLRTFQYNSKKEFVEDLNLIWQNCLTYNADPKHYLRVDAHAMQKKSNALAQLIPDIVVRDRADVEREAALAAQQEKEKDADEDESEVPAEDEKKSESTRAVGSLEKKARKGVEDADEDSEEDEPEETKGESNDETKEASKEETKEESKEETNEESKGDLGESKEDVEEPKAEVETEEPKKEEPEKSEDVEMTDDKKEDDEEEENGSDNEESHPTSAENDEDVQEDLESATWKALTSSTRYKICEERSKMFKDNRIHMNSEALFRDETQMSDFMSYLGDGDVVFHRNTRNFDENDDPYLLEYDVTGGVPPVHHKDTDYDSVENALLEKMLAEGQTLEELPDSGYKVKEVGSNNLILENISLMQDIRLICFRINLIRQMQTTQFFHRSQLQPPPIERLKFDDIDALSKLPTRDTMNEDVAAHALQKSVCAILMANGFESTNPSCASMVAQIAENYFANLVKSLKLHTESASINKLSLKGEAPFSLKEILEMVLYENGITKPDVIYTYYKEYLAKRNKKLNDLYERLGSFLRDLLRPGLQDLSEKQFNDDSEQFLSGEFSDELGDDFFGFKELGLDKEFGMLTKSVPLHLLHSRLSSQFSNGSSKETKTRYDDFKEIKFPKMHKKDIPAQIGLLQHYYAGLLEKSQALYAKQLRRQQQAVSEHNTSAIDPNFKEIQSEDDLIIIEDDDLPIKQRNNRPRVPPNGRIVQTKKKLVANAFFLDQQDEWHKPVKTE